MTAFPYTLSPDPRPTLGLIVLQSDETIEVDFHRLIPDAPLMVSRVPSGLEVTQDTLSAMAATLPAAAGMFPDAARFAAIGYGCTSGTAVIGQSRVASLIGGAAKTQAVTEPVSALIAACAALGLTNLALLSPYIETVSQTLRDVLAANGIATPVFGSFKEAEEAKVARIAGPSVITAATALAARGGADALFLSCTNLRTLDVVARIEQDTGLPVLSSNLALAWHMRRLSGLGPLPAGFGTLSRT